MFPFFSSLLLILAHPPFGIYPLAWVGFLPLFFSIRETTPNRAFLKGFITGSIFFLGILYWIVYAVVCYGNISIFLAIFLLFLLIFYLSLYFAIFCYILCILPWKHPPLIAAIWVGLEYIRGHLFTGFPWMLLGDSQYRWLTFIQIAEIGGVYLISFLIMWGNASIFYFILKKDKKAIANFIFFIIVFVLALFYGHNRLIFWQKISFKKPHLKLALIQGNINQAQKWDPKFQTETIKIYKKLTKKVTQKSIDLIIWPETALPFYLQELSPFREEILNLARTINTPILTGSPAYEWKGKKIVYFNRAYLIDKNGKIKGYYDKVHLVPFGEYIPCRKLFPFLSAIASNIGDFTPGKEMTVLKIDNYLFSVLICFESIFPELSREAVRKGAEFLVNITNDAWFGYTSAPYQHLFMLTLRAIETRRAIPRVANTGFTAFIEPTGHILKKTKLFKRDYLIDKIPIIHYQTFYVRHGDILCFISLLILITFTLAFSLK